MNDNIAARPGPLKFIPRSASARVAIVTALAAKVSYVFTASRTITWWDGSSYPLAASTLGIPGAPGSLLLTLLGWMVHGIPLVHPVAFRLNLFAGSIAAATVGLVTWLAIRLAAPEDREPGAVEIASGAIAGLLLAFGVTVWMYANQFTPYILSAFFTAWILAVALDWWRRAQDSDQRGRLFLLFLIFGLDFSVHRTNELLLPAALVWIALRRPRGWTRPANWGAAFAGLSLGLAFHLLLIPLARRNPAFLIDDPRDLASFWSYVSIEQRGGGFLVKLLPRTADFLHVQLADYVAFLRKNLSSPGPWPLRFLPAWLVMAGWILTLRSAPRRGLGLLGFFLCGGLGAVFYFNLPAHYFRSMDRHYLPSLVVSAPMVAVAASALIRFARRVRGVSGFALALGVGGFLALAPVRMWMANRRDCDLSRIRFAETVSRDVLETLPRNAILLTNGDNDSFPLWYLQEVEGVRTDVAVVNLPCTNTGWYLAQLRRRHPDLSRLLERERGPGVLSPTISTDTTAMIPVGAGANSGLPPGTALPESVSFRMPRMMLAQDRIVLDLLRLNQWRRPLCLALTMDRQNLTWLWPCARLDGMAWRIVPSIDPNVMDLARIRHVLIDEVRYAGVADTTIAMDSDTRGLCGNYLASLSTLAYDQSGRGDLRGALATLDFLERHVPPKRLGLEADPLVPFRAQLETKLGVERAVRR